MKVKVLRSFWNYGIHPDKADEYAAPGDIIDVSWMNELEDHESAAMSGWSFDDLIKFYEARGTFVRVTKSKEVQSTSRRTTQTTSDKTDSQSSTETEEK